MRRLGRDVLVRVLARVAASGMQAATLLLLARLLGPDSFGTFSVFAAAGALLTAIVSVGAATRVLRVLAEADDSGHKLAPALFWIQLVGCLLVLAGLIVASVLLGNPAPALIGTLVAFSDHQVEFSLAYLSGMTRQTMASILILVQRASALAAVAIAGSTMAAFVILGAASVAVCGFAIALAPARRTERAAVRHALRTSAGYWSLDIVPNLRQLEPLVVGVAGGTTAAGVYAISTRVINPLTILVASLQAVTVPELAKAKGKPEFGKLFRILLLITSLYAGALVVASPLIAGVFIFLTGPEYEEARTLVTVMVVCAALSAIAQAFQARLLVLGQPAKPAWIVGAGTVAGLVLLGLTAWMFGSGYIWIAPLAAQLIIVVAMALVPARQPAPLAEQAV